ncbi:cytochrome oxidase putative small subunit CydP [Candidatus Methylospira mobilis]|uniref:cytochrome oxidase putative small subunit CydP n=1 Tax=Candidatus Methylospira mobilis TaxID=1808979 RepID=UPI00387EE70D
MKKEFSLVFAVKIVLLCGLWAVFFRHDGKTSPTDVAAVIFVRPSAADTGDYDPKLNGGNSYVR